MDSDLVALQAVRDAVKVARAAQQAYAGFSQDQIDRVCEAMVEAGWRNSRYLAELACEETGMGRPDSKHLKNFVGLRLTWDSIRDLRTTGVVHRDEARRVYELVDPFGVVAAIVPTTNPTSTAMFKILIALKTRNAIVISPHPRAVRCTGESARILAEAAVRAGAPEGLVHSLTQVTLESTQALMRHPGVDLILATGGSALVSAAYSAGKPAYGVGPGNVPAYVHASADLPHAAACIVASQTFDNGTICSSEQSLVLDRRIAPRLLEELVRLRAHVATPEQIGRLERVVVKGRTMNPEVVGKFPWQIAQMAGFEVPRDTTVLLAPYERVGPAHPLSYEILAPILSVYVEDDHGRCKARCLEVLRFEGLGHTLGLHATDEAVVWEMAHEMPVYRFHVNAPTTQASVGFAVNIDPSMTLGCGSPGGNITGDNITARHLLCTKRVGFIDPAFDREHIQPLCHGRSGPAAAQPAPAVQAEAGRPAEGAAFPINNVIQVPARPYLMEKHVAKPR